MKFVQRKAEWERKEILRALKANRTVTAAAKALETNRTHLYHRIRALGIPWQSRRYNRIDWARLGL